jgi:hypothetical protein
MIVLTNWRRPQNIAQILYAIKRQSVAPIAVACIDNAESGYELPACDACRFDAYFRVERPNYGPPCRFIPALASYAEYCLFLDDDLSPGWRMLETFQDTAKKLRGQFSTLCQIGRIFEYHGHRVPPWHYKARNVPLQREPIRVDMGCRAHFFRTRDLHHVIQFNWDLIDAYGEQARIEVARHDDLSLCLGLQRALNLPTYILPENLDRSTWINGMELPDNDALSSMPLFKQVRSEFIHWADQIGWQSLVSR